MRGSGHARDNTEGHEDDAEPQTVQRDQARREGTWV